MGKPKPSLPRTKWAEHSVEEFLSLPFVSEFVFRSPQTVGATQREVVDFLIAHGDIGILISQKCQEDPTSRDAARTESWVRKKAKDAVSQLCGALRTGVARSVWCVHPRRGRVEFPNGLPKINHGLVLVETFQPVDLQPEAAELPLDFKGTPITYLSVNDFLNLAVELRTAPELLEYLNARSFLPANNLRVIGDEKSLFEFYLLNGGSFHGCASRTDALQSALSQQDEVQRILISKAELDRYSRSLEDVANQLSTRNPAYSDGMPGFEPRFSRTGYLQMQDVIANLRLRERAELGRFFDGVIKQSRNATGDFGYISVRLDPRPDWVFVFGFSKKLHHAMVHTRMHALALGAMAYYGKERSLTIVDRDGESYEVLLCYSTSPPTAEEYQAGERLFAHLRILDWPLSLVPQIQ